MEEKIYRIYHFLTLLIFLYELILALKIVSNNHVQNFIRSFFLYPLIGTIVTFSFILEYFDIFSSYLASVINTISLLFHYLFLSFFIYNVTGKFERFKVTIFFILILLIISTIYDILNRSSNSFAFANGSLFIFSLFYFYNLFNGHAVVYLSNNPIFYFCCGIFIGSGLIVPTTLMAKHLSLLNVSIATLKILSVVSGFGYLIMNLLFIKALLYSNKR